MHRKLSEQQKAAHLLLPAIQTVVADLRTELETVTLAGKGARDRDGKADWAVIRTRAEARVEGAAAVLEKVRGMARE
jgi:hypothetical protein